MSIGAKIEIRNKLLLNLYKDSRTVFPLSLITASSFADYASRTSLLQKLNYYVSTGNILNIRRGIYAKPGYDSEELSCSIYIPSYISIEYVLHKASVISQHNNSLTCISYLSRAITIEGIDYKFRKVKNDILTNTAGVISDGNIRMATPERAFLDILYLEPRFQFNNLQSLNKEKALTLLPIYKCRQLERRVSEILK